MLGIAGQPNTSKLAAVGAASPALMGIAGANTPQIIQAAHTARHSHAGKNHRNAGDLAQLHGWAKACWLLDYTFLVTPYAPIEGSRGQRLTEAMRWRDGYQAIFDRAARSIPLILDSTGFRRMQGTAPKWAGGPLGFDRYCAAIDLTDPDGFISYDDPSDRAVSLLDLARLEARYPDDPRLWPVWSARWSWEAQPAYRLSDLPRWASTKLADLVPRTPSRPLPANVEELARLAVCNAVATARDPDFQRMVSRYGKVAIGGMVKGPVHRMVRHLYVKALRALQPAHYWLLGQAATPVVNGLAYTGQIGDVSVDGSHWIQEAVVGVIAYVEGGLINSLTINEGRDSFFTTNERMAALLRSLLAVYAGTIKWPSAPELPIDFADLAQLRELQQAYQGAQLDLGWGE